MKEQTSRAVLITGASSGIGRASALLLAERGFRVFAGVRQPRDGEALRAEGGAGVVPLTLDVTDGASIAAAVRTVSGALAGRGLDGLVNNAGIATMAPVEYISAEQLRRDFEVNVFGQIAVTQAFLPLIRRARGRIVNMGSVGGHITIPFGGALCASKSAFGSLNDALRLELRPFGIHVAIIEPGAIATPAVGKTMGDVESVIRALPPEGAVRYGDKLRQFSRRGHERESNGSPPSVVAEVVHHALTARRPRLRYPVGADARTLVTLPRIVPERLLDRLRLRALGLPTAFASEPAVASPATEAAALRSA
jgi:NAD(P)-dependent dehydrogenase (short-subunit alcohol dehydrogenase family)